MIEGNLIGTDVTGTKVLGNPFFGVSLVNVAGVTVGGTAAGAGNVIAGASEGGIGILSGNIGYADLGCSNNLIEGNLVGINFDSSGNPISGLGNGDAVFPYGNDGAGIYISDPADPNQTSTGNTIGGTAAGAGNVIANNLGPGVAIVGANAFDDPILGNQIYGNTGLGIDLGDDGVTPNHSTPTTGIIPGTPNGDQNYPVLTFVQYVPSMSGPGGTTIIDGTLQADPNSTYIVQLFADLIADPSGYGQGQVLLGSLFVSTDAYGNGSFSAQLTTANMAGEAISATATDPNGNTSEFAQDVILPSMANVYVNGAYAGDPMGTLVAVPGGTRHEVGYDAFGTIQEALNAVAPGGTINIAAGTYTGPIDITQEDVDARRRGGFCHHNQRCWQWPGHHGRRRRGGHR